MSQQYGSTYKPYRQNRRFDWGRTIPFQGESVPGGRPGIDTGTNGKPDAAGMDAEVMSFEEWRENWSQCDQMSERE